MPNQCQLYNIAKPERGGTIGPGKVFDLELSLADAAEGYRAMDERRAIKALLRM